MKFDTIEQKFSLICVLYKAVLRRIIVDLVDDPQVIWDDYLLDFCDRVFEFEIKKK